MVNNKYLILRVLMIALCGSTMSTVHGQKTSPKTATRFLAYLNYYRSQQLAPMLADNFRLRRTYSDLTQDKAAFLDKYIPQSKAYNGKFMVLDRQEHADTTVFFVEDHSDYLKRLDISSPKWYLKVILNAEGLVESMIIDTAAGYSQYQQALKEKSKL